MMHAMARGSRVLTPPYLLRLLADGYYEDKVMETYRSAMKLGTKRPKMLAAFMIESKLNAMSLDTPNLMAYSWMKKNGTKDDATNRVNAMTNTVYGTSLK